MPWRLARRIIASADVPGRFNFTELPQDGVGLVLMNPNFRDGSGRA
jgi:hypothetical protein